jgi:hypothetical protein
MSRFDPVFVLKQLSTSELRAFIDNGFLLLRGVFDRELAQSIIPLVWNEMEESEDAPLTWTQPIRIVEKVLADLPIDGILTERYRASLDDLCGSGKWETNRGVGYWLNIFPQWPASHLKPRPLDFHIDTKTSADPNAANLGLVVVEFFSDVEAGGGGTGIRVGSHREVARIAADTGFQANDDDVALRALDPTQHLPVVQITARAGDVLLMHPFTLHGSSSNITKQVRIAANRPISLFEPMNFKRNDPSLYSPVEWAVIGALDERGV